MSLRYRGVRQWASDLPGAVVRVNRIATRFAAATLACLCAALAATLACARGAGHVPDAAGIDVRQYLGDARRSADRDETISPDARERWRASAGRGTLGSVALGDSVAVVAAVDRYVTALATRDGRTYWHKRLDAPLGAGALVSGGRVYVGEQSGGGHVVALRLRDGKRVWRRAVGGTSSPLQLRAGTIYGVSRAGTAFALNAEDGRVKWERRLGAGSRTGPIALGTRV